MAPIPRLKPYSGPALFSYGFRPFFLFGALYAGLAVLAWLPIFTGELALASAFVPRDWHVHEMLYGYVPAVVTGFLLTAIPNWTGRLPLQGTPLIGLLLVWVAGRAAVTLSGLIGWFPAALIDSAFLLLVAAAAAREIVAGGNWSNLKVVSLIALLALGNICFHLEAHVAGVGRHQHPSRPRGCRDADHADRRPHRAELHAQLARSRKSRPPAGAVRPLRYDGDRSKRGRAYALGRNSAAITTGGALLIAGMLQSVRLARWAGDRTARERLVLILHLGYVFIPIGFLLVGLAAFNLVPAAAGIHAWAGGAVGTMTLAVMTRASLGHTGRALIATRATQAIYAAVLLAALTRIAAAMEPAHSLPLIAIAAALWAAAFIGFALAYRRVLVGSIRAAA